MGSELGSKSGQSILLITWSCGGVETREPAKKWITLLKIVDAFGTSRMLPSCCIVCSPFSLAVTALFQYSAVYSRSIHVELSKRIIAPVSNLVHADIRIGSLDFQKGPLNETTANELPEGI
jgi:hypothetical protein